MISWRAALLVLVAMLTVRPAHADDLPVHGNGNAQVLASIRPLALITRALVGDALEVRTLPGVATAPHHFVLRPSGLQALRSAALFVWMGPALEQPLERLIAHEPAIPALAVMPMLAAGSEADPHLWLDPRQAVAIAGVLAARLREQGLLDEAQAAPALARFEESMRRREAAIAASLAGVEQVPFISMHDGLRVFVARFGLAQAGALPATHERQPGARSLAALRRVAIERGVGCLFREPGDSDDLARTLAEGTAMRIVELDVLARQAPDTVQGFDEFLQNLAQTMADCLRAAPVEPS